MSVSPLDHLTPPLAVLGKHDTVQAGREALAAGRSFWPHLTVLTAFWIYVALSNVLYANSMQASLSSMKIEHVFAAWDARLIQHLLLYPLFLLSMWRSLRTCWARGNTSIRAHPDTAGRISSPVGRFPPGSRAPRISW